VKAIDMWGQVYASGDKYSRQKAVTGLDRILPRQAGPYEGVAPLQSTMSPKDFAALIAELFKGTCSETGVQPS